MCTVLSDKAKAERTRKLRLFAELYEIEVRYKQEDEFTRQITKSRELQITFSQSFSVRTKYIAPR